MQSLNPHGKIQAPMIFFGSKTLYKEQCECDTSIPMHWNVVLQTSIGEDHITEDVLFQTDNEALADYFINIICDEELTGEIHI